MNNYLRILIYILYKSEDCVDFAVFLYACVCTDCRCAHGVCDNRPGSQGVCRRNSCLSGYTGELCDLTATLCDSDGAFEHCHIHAYCTRVGDINTSVTRLQYTLIILTCFLTCYANFENNVYFLKHPKS